MFIALAHVCNDVRAAAGCCRGITTKQKKKKEKDNEAERRAESRLELKIESP